MGTVCIAEAIHNKLSGGVLAEAIHNKLSGGFRNGFNKLRPWDPNSYNSVKTV